MRCRRSAGKSCRARRRSAGFLAGLIEGEGSCTISIKQHATAKFGFYVDPEFFIYQHKNRRAVLELAIDVFQSGRIHPKHGYPDVLVYAITSTKVISEKVVPFLERYMPYSARSSDYGKFGEAVRMFESGAHRTQEGMERIVRLAYSMNHDGKQRKRPLEVVLDRILRGRTRDAAAVPTRAKKYGPISLATRRARRNTKRPGRVGERTGFPAG